MRRQTPRASLTNFMETERHTNSDNDICQMNKVFLIFLIKTQATPLTQRQRQTQTLTCESLSHSYETPMPTTASATATTAM